MEDNILFKEESYRIVGASFEVYREKGCGFYEPVYQECMEIELEFLGIPFVVQKKLQLTYRDRVLRQYYEPDFVCYDKVIVELKAVTELTDAHRAQVYNYLKASGYQLGLLINFGHYPMAEVERIVVSRGRFSLGPRNTPNTRKEDQPSSLLSPPSRFTIADGLRSIDCAIAPLVFRVVRVFRGHAAFNATVR